MEARLIGRELAYVLHLIFGAENVIKLTLSTESDYSNERDDDQRIFGVRESHSFTQPLNTRLLGL